jgi:catechol 2,3-dioxygenase-like lactoylglutathione lyase family enzyme
MVLVVTTRTHITLARESLVRFQTAEKEERMFAGGLVTVFVTDMDRSVRFYTEQLGLKLLQRYGNEFATVDGGHGLTIGLHPAATASTAVTKKSGVSIGLYLTGSIRDAVTTLEGRGITFDGPIIKEDKAGMFAFFNDPDGNSLYLAEMKPEYKNEAAGVR